MPETIPPTKEPSETQEKNEKQQKPETRASIQRRIRKWLEPITEYNCRCILFWENDDEKIGILIREIHNTIVHATLFSYILVHTLFPSYWLLCALWVIIGLSWAHHILTGSCIFTRIEQRLMKVKTTISDYLLELFHIPVTNQNTMGFTVCMSTFLFATLSLELFSRTILNISSILPRASFFTES